MNLSDKHLGSLVKGVDGEEIWLMRGPGALYMRVGLRRFGRLGLSYLWDIMGWGVRAVRFDRVLRVTLFL